jgi:hypothetical protein
MRALLDYKGEVFGYLRGTTLYTLNDEETGKLTAEYVVDLAGNPVWRVYGDGVYSLDGFLPIGYFGPEMPPEYEI